MDTLLAELGDWRPAKILLTHIHLDHAGAAGALAQRWPDAEVWVHERGARHMLDPSRLMASAARIYGDDMHRLWGDMHPVPEDRLRVLSGGERIGPWHVEYTPGHAWHHVSYLHEPTGTALVGDVAGIRIAGGPVLPPTPPPDPPPRGPGPSRRPPHRTSPSSPGTPRCGRSRGGIPADREHPLRNVG